MNKFKEHKNVFDRINQYSMCYFLLELLLLWMLFMEKFSGVVCILSAMIIFQNATFVELWKQLNLERINRKDN